jgi:peptide/nickel transport system substrate-binding protein
MMRNLALGVAALAVVGMAATPVAADGASSAPVAHPRAQDGDVTMTIGLRQDLSSPNVTVGYLVADYELWNLQYATLTDKAADDFSTIPGLAESWEGTDDGLTWTYTLREGLTWSDGEPLTADDIAYTINRSRDEEWYNHSATTQNLEATALDERTVEIATSVPDPKLPTMDVYIVPKHIYESLSAEELASYDGLDGVASGQYSLQEWRSGQDWTMVKNPSWYGRDNGIDRLVFRVFSNADAMVAAIQRGEIDFAHDIPAGSFEQLGAEDDIETVAGQQGSFTELALNGMAGGIGDGHPALQDIAVRHAIYHAVNREGLFQRVNLGLGAVGTTISPSADPSWIPDLGDENFTYDPDLANEMLDEAGYLDTDGDGVREMPDGSRPLEFRYAERSEGVSSAAIREFMIGFLDQIGIALVVEVMDDAQLYDIQVRGEYDMFEWGWTPFVDPDPQLSYFTCAEVTTDPDEPGNNDANWCDERYDELYEQQKVELDPERRREIVAEMLRLFNTEGTYLVLTFDPDLQAYRTDRFEGWLQQPAEVGPVLFTNSSPTYANLTVIE